MKPPVTPLTREDEARLLWEHGANVPEEEVVRYHLRDAPPTPPPAPPDDAEALVRSFLPRGTFDVGTTIMRLARLVRLNLGIPRDSPRIDEVVQSWHRQARTIVPELDEYPVVSADFFRAYDRARVPVGEDVLAKAVDRMNDPSIRLPACYRFEEGTKAALVYRLARAVAEGAGGEDFFVPCPRVEALTGVNRRIVHRCLLHMEGLGIIRCDERGRQGHKRATRYRWASTGHEETKSLRVRPPSAAESVTEVQLSQTTTESY